MFELLTMEKRLQPPAVKVERTIYDLAEKERLKELKKGNPIALSSLNWISYLIKRGMEGLKWNREQRTGLGLVSPCNSIVKSLRNYGCCLCCIYLCQVFRSWKKRQKLDCTYMCILNFRISWFLSEPGLSCRVSQVQFCYLLPFCHYTPLRTFFIYCI